MPELSTVITPAAYASRPAAGKAGQLFLPTDSVYVERDTGSAWQSWGPIFPCTPPVNGDFAWINQGGASVDTTFGGVHLLAPAGAGENLRIRKKTAPATPYVITAGFLPLIVAQNTPSVGLCFRQSSDGKLAGLSLVGETTSVKYSLYATKFTDPTTFSATYTNVGFYPTAVLWLRIADDGASRICSWSPDGQHWFVLHSIGRTDFLTADEVGFFVNANNATFPAGATLLSWAQT